MIEDTLVTYTRDATKGNVCLNCDAIKVQSITEISLSVIALPLSNIVAKLRKNNTNITNFSQIIIINIIN